MAAAAFLLRRVRDPLAARSGAFPNAEPVISEVIFLEFRNCWILSLPLGASLVYIDV